MLEPSPHAAAILTLKDVKKKPRKLDTCDCCGAKVKNIIGCPSGAEICKACFDNGEG